MNFYENINKFIQIKKYKNRIKKHNSPNKLNFILTKVIRKKNGKIKFWQIYAFEITTSQTDTHFIKLLFWFLHRRKNQQFLEYHRRPFYAILNYKFTKFISKYFRFALIVPPILSSVKLGFNFTNSFKWYFLVGITGTCLIFNIIHFIRDLIFKARVKAHIKSIVDNGSIFIRYGVPGSGKTSSLFSDFKILSDIMWKKICLEYKLLKPYLNEIKYWKDELREDAEEIVEAYNFYKNSKTYPCLWSTVPAFVDGVSVNRLTAEHLLQREKLPYGSVCICDEMSLIMPQELHHNRPIEVKELCKFPRHIGDLHLGTTEQSKDNMLNDFRNSASEFKCMVKQVWVLRPRLLIYIYEKLIKILPSNKITSNFFRIWQKINNSIGYRKYYYYNSGTADNVKKSDVKTFVLPSVLSVRYDDRAFRNIYRCKNKPLKVSSWNHLRMSKDEIEEIFTKELEERTKTKEQKKAEAQAKRLAKKGEKADEV